MKTNETLQKDVEAAIKWEPILNGTQIKVKAEDGVITLTGFVDIYAKKIEVEYVAKKMAGVKVVIENIEIKFDSSLNKSDGEIANEVLNDLKWRQIPEGRVKVSVNEGWVTLEGKLRWDYQREIAKSTVNYVVGVKGITNNISIELETHDRIEKSEIERALARSSTLDFKDVHVKVLSERVILTGKVNTVYQKEEAERIVWKAPGVWNLDNELVVG